MTPVPIQPWILPQSPSAKIGEQAFSEQVETEGSIPAGKAEGASQDVEDTRDQGASEVERMLDEEKGESEALTSYLRGLLQDDCETSLQRKPVPADPAVESTASFAFTSRLANLKMGF